jgi:hypothetical protein
MACTFGTMGSLTNILVGPGTTTLALIPSGDGSDATHLAIADNPVLLAA